MRVYKFFCSFINLTTCESFVIINSFLPFFSSFYNSVTHKVTAGAKSFGSFLSGVVNKAGDRIKETVKHNVRIIRYYIKTQIKFIFFILYSLYLESLIRSKKHSLKINQEKIQKLEFVHGSAIKMKIKLRKKFLAYQA